MILHAVTIQNWKNIGRLELTDLDHPLVVLYGPNRTGKSSIVEAIRCCLYDFDHDATAGRIKCAIPWLTKQVPEIRVEFETGGQRYRLMKRFDKGKQGDAVLERRVPVGRSSPAEWTTLHRGKEASREARRILGVTKSTDGLNQLLWLTQGEIHLPEGNRLNAPLQERLESVLGQLLTAHDWDFSRTLEKACQRYFTPQFREKKDSPVTLLEQQRSECRRQVEVLSGQLRQAEQLVRDFHGLHAGLAEERQLIEASRHEVQQLIELDQATRQKRAEHKTARLRLDTAEKEYARAEKSLADYVARAQDLLRQNTDIAGLEDSLKQADASVARLRTNLERTQQHFDRARSVVSTHEQRSGELADRQLLIDLAGGMERVAARLEEFDGQAAAIAGMQTELAGISAPEEAELRKLRTNRSEAQKRRATLEAESLRLEIEPAGDGSADVSLDGEPPRAVALDAGAPLELQFRQQAEVSIGSFGKLRVRRGTQNFSIEEAATNLRQLDQEYVDALRTYGVAADEDEPLALLDQRACRRQELRRALHTAEDAQRRAAPDGRQPLAAERSRLEQQRAAILERRPELAEWQPDAVDLHARQADYNEMLHQLRRTSEDLQSAVETRRRECEQADNAAQTLRTQLAGLKATRQAHVDELTRMGDETALAEAQRTARAAVDGARLALADTMLTPDEQNIEARLNNARHALEQRQDRLRETENRCEGIRGELRGLHGLHDDLAAAEAELRRLDAEFREHQLDAEAHRLLHGLFDECRMRQVRAATGRIGERVLDWARRLGLDDYDDCRFADGYLPAGMLRPGLDEAVVLADESFGTMEQLAMLVRLAVGGLLAGDERQVAILDDPLTHADSGKHRRMLEILEEAARGRHTGNGSAVAPLQILVFTCHPERFDHVPSAKQIDLAARITRA
ncbi:MAG TPA: AAA family ATPase [Planctomycetaceae bacterium]|nr:AAA family ATPase [Planctomycetaceae bacterium]